MGESQNYTQGPKYWFVETNILFDLNLAVYLSVEDDKIDQEILNQYATCILNAKFSQIHIAKISANQKHLPKSQNDDKHDLLSK